MARTILERATTLRKHYGEGCAYAMPVEMRRMLALLVEAKAESVGARERRFVREIERYQALVA